ncbi:MAG TPA: Holliday junction branch migration protein RuvA [Anaerolineales bacterium]|nr:Holliday junction branch migration protein RuvA [Anaerolineales bacterium]
MIATLHGKVVYKEKDSLIVEIGGVGLEVAVPAPLRDRTANGDTVTLYTYLVVRENELSLYGFETREEKEFFELLLGVSGIGPKTALSTLSTLNPDSIRRAVFHEQPEVFSRVPGLGKKTAQKVLLHLQDKIKAVDSLSPVAAMTDADTEVLEALTTLGYSVIEAQAALQAIPRDAPQDVETRLRLALQYFS